MERVGLGNAPIDAVLVTHEHSDHVAAARVLSNRLRSRTGQVVPFFMTEGTRSVLNPKMKPERIETISSGEVFQVKHLRVDPFTVPHDCVDPVAYRVCVGGIWAGVITDLGRTTSLVESKLRSLSAAVLEFNHDVDMLLESRYPWPTKQRIRSSHGHLSNKQAGELLSRALIHSPLQHLILAHLSDENNSPARALQWAVNILRKQGAHERVKVHVADQREPMIPIQIQVSDW